MRGISDKLSRSINRFTPDLPGTAVHDLPDPNRAASRAVVLAGDRFILAGGDPAEHDRLFELGVGKLPAAVMEPYQCRVPSHPQRRQDQFVHHVPQLYRLQLVIGELCQRNAEPILHDLRIGPGCRCDHHGLEHQLRADAIIVVDVLAVPVDQDELMGLPVSRRAYQRPA